MKDSEELEQGWRKRAIRWSVENDYSGRTQVLHPIAHFSLHGIKEWWLCVCHDQWTLRQDLCHSVGVLLVLCHWAGCAVVGCCFRLLRGSSSPREGEGGVRGQTGVFTEGRGGEVFSSCILIEHLFLTAASSLTSYFFQQIILSDFWLPHYRVLLLKATQCGNSCRAFPSKGSFMKYFSVQWGQIIAIRDNWFIAFIGFLIHLNRS